MRLHEAAALAAIASLGISIAPVGEELMPPRRTYAARKREVVQHVTTEQPLTKRQKRRMRGKGHP